MTWDIVITVLSWLCFLAGGFFLFVGALGMLRLPDFWSRLHAASIIDSAGVGLIFAGMMLQTGFTLVTVKTLLIVGFLLITGPTASHAVASAAFVSGSRPKDIVEDETLVPSQSKLKTLATQKKKAAQKKRPTKRASAAARKSKA